MNSTSALKTFYCFDLDRTLFDTVAFTQEILAITATFDSKVAGLLRKKVDEYFARNQPFALRQHIETYLGTAIARQIEATLLSGASAHSLLLEGARESLDFAGDTFGILTYGETTGQAMKLRAVGLDHEKYLITDSQEKGKMIASWKQADGAYALPAAYGEKMAHEVVLIDDRMISFRGLPADARGYWLTMRPPTAAEISILPAQVVPIRSLYEFVMSEHQIDKS